MSTQGGYRQGEKPARRIQAALLLAGLATFTLLYNTQAILPALARSHEITAGHSALSVSLATIGLGLGLLAAAPLSDRIGRTPLIHGSLFTASVLGVVLAVVPDWHLFLVLRFVQGVALAGLPAVAAVYLREEMHISTVSRATALYIFGTTLGGLSGRIVSSGLLDLAQRVELPEGRWASLAEEHLALLGTALLALGCAVACRVLLPASKRFAPRRTRLRDLPGDFGRVLADPVLLGLCAISALMMGMFLGTFNSLGFRLEAPPYLLTVGAIGLVYLAYPLAGAAGVQAGKVADVRGRARVLPGCVVVALLGVLITALPWLPAILAGVLVLCCGFFMVHSVSSAWVPMRAHSAGLSPAHAASLYMLFYYAGSSISGNLTPLAWQGGGWAAVLAVTGGLVCVALVISVLLSRAERLS